MVSILSWLGFDEHTEVGLLKLERLNTNEKEQKKNRINEKEGEKKREKARKSAIFIEKSIIAFGYSFIYTIKANP